MGKLENVSGLDVFSTTSSATRWLVVADLTPKKHTTSKHHNAQSSSRNQACFYKHMKVVDVEGKKTVTYRASRTRMAICFGTPHSSARDGLGGFIVHLNTRSPTLNLRVANKVKI